MTRFKNLMCLMLGDTETSLAGKGNKHLYNKLGITRTEFQNLCKS